MALKTVRVPAAMGPTFELAEELVSKYFRDQRVDPEHGTIEIFGERYVLVRAASLSVEFFGLVEDLFGPGREAEADEFARNILFDLAHAVGKSDAQNFHAKMGLEDPIARLSAGPIHFSHTGWAFVDIFPESAPAPNADYYLIYDHPYSFESDAWLRAGRTRSFPVCIMNAGYSSGWCEESFGVQLVAAEVLCRAKGDSSCRFIMAHPDRIEAHVESWARSGFPSERAAVHQIPDFFARKRIEEELRRARDELEVRVEERTAELRRSNERLREEMEERERIEKQLLQTQKLEALGRLAGGIAHDFNNLTAVILANCGLLANRLPDADSRTAFVAEIRHAAERAANITQQLLTFGRAQLRERKVHDLGRVVEDVGRMLERLIGDCVEVRIRVAAEPTRVVADRGQIEQILVNLAVNARDAMPEGGTLAIETTPVELCEAEAAAIGGVRPGPHVVLDVSDTGVGMDDETLSHVFDPFFTTKEGGRGTGLGLSTVYGVVAQSGGHVAVESEPGSGTRFRIYLPRVEEPVSPAEPSEEGPAPRGKETVLLVEDQQRLRFSLTLVLRDLGYEVLEAAGPDEAIRIAQERDGAIDVLLSDVVMPKTTGFELADRLSKSRPGIRVLFMSGYADDDPRVAERRQDVAFLRKPFWPDALGRKLREVLDGPAIDDGGDRGSEG